MKDPAGATARRDRAPSQPTDLRANLGHAYKTPATKGP